MGKLNFNKKKVAVFLSGKGSNFKSLYKFSRKKHSRYKIILVISNKKETQGIKFPKKKNIKNFTLSDDIKYFEKKSIEILKKNKIEILCLAGFMKILSKRFILSFKNPILNIHPSILPRLKGLRTHERAIKNKHKFSGCTVHLVNSRLDSGKILGQIKVKINKNDNVKTLQKKVLEKEHYLYPNCLNNFIN